MEKERKKEEKLGKIISTIIIILFLIHPTISTQMFNNFK